MSQPENLKAQPEGSSRFGAAHGSANHRLCKLCIHCATAESIPYCPSQWCIMFMRGDHVEKQRYCGQFRLKYEDDSPNDQAQERRATDK